MPNWQKIEYWMVSINRSRLNHSISGVINPNLILEWFKTDLNSCFLTDLNIWPWTWKVLNLFIILMILIYECDIEIKCAQMATRMVSSFSNWKKRAKPGGSTLKRLHSQEHIFQIIFQRIHFLCFGFLKNGEGLSLEKAEALTAIVPFRFCVFCFPATFFFVTPPFSSHLFSSHLQIQS